MVSKQECKDCNKSLEECTCIKNTIDFPNQETLEEAAKRLYPLRNTFLERFKDLEQKIFIEGAKWQQEKIGKSEFLQRLRGTLSDAEARRLIFETFKNK
jgi:inorganic pyrophosphatase